MEAKLNGKIKIEIVGQGNTVVIPALFPFNEDMSEVTSAQIISLLNGKDIVNGYDEKLIEYALQRAKLEEKVFLEVIVAQAQKPVHKNTQVISLLDEKAVHPNNEAFWQLVDNFFENIDLTRVCNFPYPLQYVKKNQPFALSTLSKESTDGINLYGHEVRANRSHTNSYEIGFNVVFNQVKKTYIADCEGYVVFKGSTINVIPPFWLNEDNMKLYYLNLPKINENATASVTALDAYITKVGLKRKYIFVNPLAGIKPNQHKQLAEGKKPTPPIDAEIELMFPTERSIGKVNDYGRIDYKELDFFFSCDDGKLLAIKKKPVAGIPGQNLLGKSVPVRAPIDKPFLFGAGVKIVDAGKQEKLVAIESGILEYKSGIVSINPTAVIRGDVDLKSGNLRTKSNIEIMGNILAGFEVKCDKNLTVKGTIEDNCSIEVGGDLLVMGGIVGEECKVQCNGDLSARYINAANVKCGGSMIIERFVMGADIECKGALTVLGRKIKAKEIGVIVDSNIKVRESVVAPSIGSEAGLVTNISLGWDEGLFTRINHTREALEQMQTRINELSYDFEYDLMAENIVAQVTDLPQEKKDQIFAARREILAINKKIAMMEDILIGENKQLEKLLDGVFVQIHKHCLPTLVIHVNKLQKTFYDNLGPSKFYYDIDTQSIRRTGFVGSTSL